jgi:general secretion pathway protein G
MIPLLTANTFDNLKRHETLARETAAEEAGAFSRAHETSAEGAGAFRPLESNPAMIRPLGPGVLKGHGFSRAVSATRSKRALAPEGCLSAKPLRIEPSSADPNLSIAARHSRSGERGLTLVELIVTVFILTILATAALPLVRFQVKRQRERELRFDLWEMRDAIDKYKDAADKGAFQTKVESQNYPPDLDTLVNGVDVQGKKLKFLRKIPVDPMTGQKEWGMRSMQDDPDSDSWGGQSVFDVYTKSQGTALDGTKYSTW